MPTIRMFNAEVLRRAVQLKNRQGGVRNGIHAARFEICIAQRRVDEDVSRRERTDEFSKIERKVVQSSRVFREPGHVPCLAPAMFGFPNLWIAPVIVNEGIEAATGDDHLDAFVEHRREDGVVTAERMSDDAECAA